MTDDRGLLAGRRCGLLLGGGDTAACDLAVTVTARAENERRDPTTVRAPPTARAENERWAPHHTRPSPRCVVRGGHG
ncbi:MAG: hypothetical protein ACRCYX_15325 [Dermatophilaceae bacterium]